MKMILQRITTPENKRTRPQDYLSADPADLMLTSFLDLLQLGALTPITKQCQRWGAAYVHRSPRASKFSQGPCLVQASPAIAVCGDFLSAALRGGMASVHSAAVSGLAAADAVAKLVWKDGAGGIWGLVGLVEGSGRRTSKN